MAIVTFDQAVKSAGVAPDQVTSLGVPGHPVAPAATPDAPTKNIFERMGESATNEVTTQWKDAYEKAKKDVTSGTVVGGFHLAGDLGQAVLAPFAATVNALTGGVIPKAVNAAGDAIGKSDIASPVLEKLNKYFDLHPDAKRVIFEDIPNILNLATLGVGGGEIKAPLGDVTAGLARDAKTAAGAVVDTAAPVISKTGTVLKNLGEKATEIGVTPTEPTRIAMQAYQAEQPSLLGRVKNFITDVKPEGTKPVTEANTAARLGMAGTEWQLGVQAKRIATSLFEDKIRPALESNPDKISKTDFLDSIRTRIIKDNPDLTRRNTLINALDSFAEDYKKVNQFGLSKLQDYKSAWAKFVPEKAYKGNPIAGALNEVRNMAAQEARKIIYNKLGNDVKTAYLDYGNLQSIEQSGIKSIDALRSKGVTRQVWEAFLDKAVTPIATFAGKVLYRLGDGMEMLGEPGAKNIRDIVTVPVKSQTPNATEVPITTPPKTNLPVQNLPSDYEFYQKPSKLPVIQMGEKATSKFKKSDPNLPTIK